MAIKRKKKAAKDQQLKVGGINVYEDEKGRTIYYNRFDHNGYVLTDYEKAYRPFALRFFLGVFAGVLAYMFELPILYSGIIGVAFYIVMEVRFRLFLKKLPQIANFKPKKRQGRLEAEKGEDTSKLILKFFLYLAFAVLIFANAILEKYTGVILYFNYALAIFGVIMALLEIRALLIKNKK